MTSCKQRRFGDLIFLQVFPTSLLPLLSRKTRRCHRLLWNEAENQQRFVAFSMPCSGPKMAILLNTLKYICQIWLPDGMENVTKTLIFWLHPPPTSPEVYCRTVDHHSFVTCHMVLYMVYYSVTHLTWTTVL